MDLNNEQIEAMKFYDEYEAHNQYYVDRARFNDFYSRVGGGYDGSIFNYDKTLLELSKNGLFLKEINDDNINKKMCVIALYQSAQAVKYIPKDLLGEIYVEFDTRRLRSENADRDRDCAVLGAIMKEITDRGLAIHKVVTSGDKRRVIDGKFLYRRQNRSQFWEDKRDYKVIHDSSNVFDGMSYDEVLANLNHDGMMLARVPCEARNKNMCEIAMNNNQSAKNHIPLEHLKNIERDEVNRKYDEIAARNNDPRRALARTIAAQQQNSHENDDMERYIDTEFGLEAVPLLNRNKRRIHMKYQ